MGNPSFWRNNDDDDYVAQTIDLDERKENTERGFMSEYKYKEKSPYNYQKADTVRGIPMRNDGKVDIKASIDFINVNRREDSEKSPMSRNSVYRRDSGITTHSINRLNTYRSINHEPSVKKSTNAISRSNYSALKSHKERFSSQRLEDGHYSSSNLTMKRHNSDVDQSVSQTSKMMKYGERSELNVKSVMDYDETLYNIQTMKEKGFVTDPLPIRAGCFSPDGMHLSLGTNSK